MHDIHPPAFLPEDADLARGWEAPQRTGVLIDETHAMMSQPSFDKLLDYSVSMPSGVYPGKMWKAHVRGEGWFLRWYGQGPPGMCTNNERKILIVE